MKTYSTATITRVKIKNGIMYGDDLEETRKRTEKFIKKYKKEFKNLKNK